ncbi:MmgE/PrpD family protein [Burkholderia sp. JPY481]
MSDTALLLGEFVAGLTSADICESALRRAAHSILDTLASAAGGFPTKNASEMREAAFAAFGRGVDNVWFANTTVHRAAALLSNCAAASALDIDDGHRRASGHPGAAIVPAVIAACSASGQSATAHKLLGACVIGYDIACRIAAARPRGSVKTYSSGRWVGYGVAAALGWLESLSPVQIANAIAIAGAESPENLPAGSYRRMSSVKGSSPWSVVTALVAVARAKAGADGPLDCLDRPDVFSSAAIIENLGGRWEVEHIYLKPYASCRYAHAATDAMLALANDIPIAVANAEEIIVDVFPEALSITNEVAPPTREGAQFSISFNVAVAASRGAAALRPLERSLLDDEEVLSVAKKVKLRVAAEFERAFPELTPSRVGVKVHGVLYTREVRLPVGDVENPMTWVQTEDKFWDLVRGQPAEIQRRSDRIIAACSDIAADFDLPARHLIVELG